MKKIALSLFALAFFISGNAQISKLFSKKKSEHAATTQEKERLAAKEDSLSKSHASVINYRKTARDHFMIQYGSDIWMGAPDSIHTKGFSRHFNLYCMFDKPFKSDPHYSVAYGAGFGSSNIFFNQQFVDIGANSTTLAFTDQSGSSHFKKFKLTEIFLEAPVEVRYFSKPINPNKSWKFAVGAKFGLLLKAYTKGKNWEDDQNNSLYGANYVSKVVDNKFFDGAKAALTARVGYGNFSLHADYQVTGVIKQAYGPTINVLSIGLAVSGL